MSGPRVFTIAPGAPFLATFAAAFMRGDIVGPQPLADDPLRLAAATLYVPTRRAARALSAEIARLLPGPVALLPRIVPLGQMDALETGLLFAEAGPDQAPVAGLPDPVDEIERRLTLARLILAWGRHLRHAIVDVNEAGEIVTDPAQSLLVTASPAHAWHLAGDLAGLIDEMAIEGVGWDALTRLVPDDYDRYWAITLHFLQIAAREWPRILDASGRMDRVPRQIALIDREVLRLGQAATAAPVIALGSTGTNQATARLLAAIARAPQGAVVLPGLDGTIDDTDWSLIGGNRAKGDSPLAGHPQATLRRLVPQLGVARGDIVELGSVSPALATRRNFLAQALRPADSTDLWQAFDATGLEEALAGLTLIEASDERQEALALAICLRHALETPDRTAALVTPDRDLARRVRAELARWNIRIDDSGGDSLATSAAGALARLLLAAAADDGVVSLAALLKHPAVRFGRDAAEHRLRAEQLEFAVLRNPFSARCAGDALIDEARSKAESPHAHPALRALNDADWTALADLLHACEAVLAPLRATPVHTALANWIDLHAAALQVLTAGRTNPGEDDRALADLFDRLASAANASDVLTLPEYAALFDAVAAGTTLRGPQQAHPRLMILGLLEARLMHADVILLGGLDETVWPPQTSTDAFLNRPMREQLGLTPPERRIGQTAHDFWQAMGHAEVIISRAAKRGGSPMVPSRFLQRMAALAGDALWQACRARGATWLDYAARLDAAGKPQGVKRPEPRPALDLRPTRLSVTRIETLRRDPYAIFAESILRLVPFDSLGVQPGARETGTELHDVLAQFTRRFPSGPLPADAQQILRDLARENLAALMQMPDWAAFQWPRWRNALDAFCDWDADRRASLAGIETETRGVLDITLLDGSVFRLSATADRIETGHDGSVVVVDFKTGGVPSLKEIAAGFAPQLTIESAMIQKGAFATLPPGARVADAFYVKLAAEIETRSVAKDHFQDRIAEQFAGMLDLLNQFRDPQTPYLSRPFPKFASRYGVYDHLARVREWSTGGGGDEA